MNTHHIDILSDISELTATFSQEDNELLLKGACKIKRHLIKQVHNGQEQYLKNIRLINEIIEIHQNQRRCNEFLTSFRKAS